MRGATIGHSICHMLQNFNPRSPCGERLLNMVGVLVILRISTHAPHAGSDCIICLSMVDMCLFQPTLPMRGATGDTDSIKCALDISTHAPHAGSDCHMLQRTHPSIISTHAPHAGSDIEHNTLDINKRISTHAPHAGSDCNILCCSLYLYQI